VGVTDVLNVEVVLVTENTFAAATIYDREPQQALKVVIIRI